MKKLFLFLLIAFSLIGLSSAVGLDVDGTTVTKCGTETYDYINVTNGGVINVCKVFDGLNGYWNVTAINYIYISANSIINASNAGANGGRGGYAQYSGSPGCTGFSNIFGNAGGLGGTGANAPAGCTPGAGGSASTMATAITDTTSRTRIDYGSGAGGGGGGSSGLPNANVGEDYSGICNAPSDYVKNGGGAIRMLSNKIEIYGKIYVNGGRGGKGGDGTTSWGGGCGASTVGTSGGAGGSGASAGLIILEGRTVNISGSSLSLVGGLGGPKGVKGVGAYYPGNDGQVGNGGPGGRLKLFYATLSNISTIINLSGGVGTSNGLNGSVYYESIATSLIINLTSPKDGSATQLSQIELNCSSLINDSVYGIQLKNISLFTDITGTYKLNQTKTITGLNNQTSFTLQLITTNRFNWTCKLCSDDDTCVVGQNYTLQKDNTKPNVSILYPTNNLSFAYEGAIIPLNFSVLDTNLESCWYEYAGVNTTVNCLQNSSFTLQLIQKSLRLWANDTAGNINSTTTSWNYSFQTNSVNYTGTVYETSNQNYILNMSFGLDYVSVFADLIYNSTLYRSSVSCSGVNCIINNSIDIPLLTSSSSNLFYWNITVYTPTTPIYFNTNSYQQNTSQITLGICNSTLTIFALNYSAKDEIDLSPIKPISFAGHFDYWLGNGNIKKNLTLDLSGSSFGLCLSNSATVYIDSEISYNQNASTNYTSRNYYQSSFPINNITQNITMYLLKAISSTSFIIQVQDNLLLPVKNAIVNAYRYYPGTNSYELVQTSMTDDGGKSVGFFQTETVDYKFVIIKNGVTLLSTNKGKIIPETSPYTLLFNTGAVNNAPWYLSLPLGNLDSTLLFNKNTSKVTYTYTDSSGSFTSARLVVIKQSFTNLSQQVVVCNVSYSAQSGIISCDLSGYSNGNFIVSAYIERDYISLDKQIVFSIGENTSTLGQNGLFYAFFIILVASCLFFWNEIVGIWAVILSIFFINLTGLVAFGTVFVTAVIAVGVILTWLLEQ